MEEIKRINDSELNADGGADLTPDGKGATLRIPRTSTASVSLPVIGQVVDLKASLELQTDVRVE